MTFPEWEKAVELMQSAFGSRLDLDAKGIIVWFELLKDLPGDRTLGAVKQLCQVAEWPSIAAIRKLAVTPDLSGEEAWVKALGYAAEHGPYPLYRGVGSIEYHNGYIASPTRVERVESEPVEPVILETIKALGGVAAIRQAKDINQLRKDFVRQYEALASGAKRRAELPALPAAPESQKVIDLRNATRAIGRPMPEVNP